MSSGLTDICLFSAELIDFGVICLQDNSIGNFGLNSTFRAAGS